MRGVPAEAHTSHDRHSSTTRRDGPRREDRAVPVKSNDEGSRLPVFRNIPNVFGTVPVAVNTAVPFRNPRSS
jgi:hypothetical protein